MSNSILVIDDDPLVQEILLGNMRGFYSMKFASNAAQGLSMACELPGPDLILLDIQLPDMHGYDVCRRLKQHPFAAEIPIIFLSGHDDNDKIVQGLKLGAVDYVNKPVNMPVLLARLETHLRLREANRSLVSANIRLESMIAERTQTLQLRTSALERLSDELEISQDMTFLALGSIAETRDNETGNHIHRTRAYVELMCRDLSRHPRYREKVADSTWQDIVKSSPLHDIGKVGIPDSILLKPGKLTQEEFEVMKQHTTIGRDTFRAAIKRLGGGERALATAIEIAYSHHERWDGTGYPEGMAGEDIPFSARIMAVADVYDALVCKRVYKPAMNHLAAVELIREGRDKHFDPDVIDCFLHDAARFEQIALRYADN